MIDVHKNHRNLMTDLKRMRDSFIWFRNPSVGEMVISNPFTHLVLLKKDLTILR